MADNTEEQGPNRGRGILTTADRAYLQGRKELTSESERNTRLRIRNRVSNALLDLELLWFTLSDKDLEQVFYPDDESGRHRLRSASQDALAFLLVGLWMNRDPHAERIEDAIEQALFAAGKIGSATLDVYHEPLPTGSLLMAKMKHKNQWIIENVERYHSDRLTDTEKNELEQRISREMSFLYYMYEKALLDSSVDPESLASFRLLGMTDEEDMCPESIREEREGWNSIPFYRYVPPKIVDIDYLPDKNTE